MSIFNELILPKIIGISKSITDNFKGEYENILQDFDKFEEEWKNARGKARDKIKKDKYVMQSILEDDDCPLIDEPATTETSEKNNLSNDEKSLAESDQKLPKRNSKKRNKAEVDSIFSPEIEKRIKRTASVKAQTNISKQVNVNLTQKLRRDNTTETRDTKTSHNGIVNSEENKENSEPVPLVKIKQEKISLLKEYGEENELAATQDLMTVEKKEDFSSDNMAMPPPAVPMPKPRKALPKSKSTDEEAGEVETTKKKSIKGRKQKESVTAEPVITATSTRELRASTRASKKAETAEDLAPPETRPKRTRAKKKDFEEETDTVSKGSHSSQDSGIASPAQKPRAKRTRRAAKDAEPSIQQSEDIPKEALVEERKLSEASCMSPIIQLSAKALAKVKKIPNSDDVERIQSPVNGIIKEDGISLDKTKVLTNEEETAMVAPSLDMDATVVLPKGVYNHDKVTPKSINNMNETVVLGQCEDSAAPKNKINNIIMDSTIVIHKDPGQMNVTEDNSLLTDDSETHTPPKQATPQVQPVSAVKEKVQQFEELATRATRTKTRAMAKNEEKQVQEIDSHTPPDRITKQALPSATLQKMNSLLFGGKTQTLTGSANKPRVNGLNSAGKSYIPTASSKLSFVRKAEEMVLKEKEDAKKKKEAILEAKKEQQRRKREEKIAAAAAVRKATEIEKQMALEAAAKDRMDRQANAELGKLERLKEIERKKQESARKAAVAEERRKAEEQARQQRLEEEQRRARELRLKQIMESEELKKECALFDKKHRECLDKLKLKKKFDEKIMAVPGGGPAHVMEPVRMEDGFEYLDSDDDASDHSSNMPVRTWCMSKYRIPRLQIQAVLSTVHVDKLFSVRVHSPDLAEIFPNIQRSRLKRTSSAVWRTPPGFKRNDN